MASLRLATCALLVGASLAASLAAQILPVRQYKSGTAVWSMDTGDLNGDGLTDIVTGGPVYNPFVSVLLRDEAGGFLPATTYAVDENPGDVALGDMNGDGLLDFVCRGSYGNSLSVRLGDGTGAFGPLTIYDGIPNNPMILADLDGDGDDDVASCDQFDDGVLILLSDAVRGLVVSGLHLVGGEPVSIAAADFDRDGALDLITTTQANSFGVSFGDGVGGFGPVVAVPTPSLTGYAITGDIDEDGDADVIAFTTGGQLLYLGNGDGTFALSPGFSVQGAYPTLADANGDGIDDLLSIGSAGVLVQLGHLGPSFDAPLAPVLVTQHVYGGLAVLEADGDGWPDVVVGGTGEYSQTVSVLPGLGFGVFESHEQVKLDHDPLAFEPADLDDDGDIDFAVAYFGYFGGAGVFVLLNDGTGEFVPASYTPTSPLFDIDSGDVDGDGDLDLVCVAQSNSMRLLLGDGSGAFPVVTSFAPLPQPQFVRLADFDGDGDDDAAVVHGDNVTGAVAVLLADGAGGFAAPVEHPVGGRPTAFAMGDLDLDGRLDLVVGVNLADRVSVLFGDGAGGFSAATHVPVKDAPTGVAIGDVTNDGRPDLVVGHSTVAPVDVVSVHPGNGAGGFLPAQIWPAGNGPGVVEIADIDSDGIADLVVTEGQGGSVALLLGQGAGAFQTPHFHPAGYWPFDLAVEDIDGDGRIDVLPLTLNNDSLTGAINVLRNLGVPEPWTSVGLGLAGTPGIPMLVGHGSLQPDEPVSLTLHGARPTSAAILVLGFTSQFAPFKGGVLVPRPHLLIGGLVTDGTGSLDLHADWPSGVPSALTVWYQLWVVDPGAVAGLAGSNGVTSTTP